MDTWGPLSSALDILFPSRHQVSHLQCRGIRDVLSLPSSQTIPTDISLYLWYHILKAIPNDSSDSILSDSTVSGTFSMPHYITYKWPYKPDQSYWHTHSLHNFTTPTTATINTPQYNWSLSFPFGYIWSGGGIQQWDTGTCKWWLCSYGWCHSSMDPLWYTLWYTSIWTWASSRRGTASYLHLNAKSSFYPWSSHFQAHYSLMLTHTFYYITFFYL